MKIGFAPEDEERPEVDEGGGPLGGGEVHVEEVLAMEVGAFVDGLG